MINILKKISLKNKLIIFLLVALIAIGIVINEYIKNNKETYVNTLKNQSQTINKEK